MHQNKEEQNTKEGKKNTALEKTKSHQSMYDDDALFSKVDP